MGFSILARVVCLFPFVIRCMLGMFPLVTFRPPCGACWSHSDLHVVHAGHIQTSMWCMLVTFRPPCGACWSHSDLHVVHAGHIQTSMWCMLVTFRPPCGACWSHSDLHVVHAGYVSAAEQGSVYWYALWVVSPANRATDRQLTADRTKARTSLLARPVGQSHQARTRPASLTTSRESKSPASWATDLPVIMGH